ncbi:MAG: hypothetical protein AAFU85_02485 [Planctomycetota bacterium]
MPKPLPSPRESAPRKLSLRVWIVTSVLAVVVLGVIEVSLRRAGFQSGPHDDDVFWVSHRIRVEQIGAKGIVCLGSSRSQADIRVDQLRELTQRPVVQLAIAGSSPLPVLEDLAERSRFDGLIVLSISPHHAFSDRPDRISKTMDWIARSHEANSSPGERLEIKMKIMVRDLVLLRQDFNWRTVANRYVIGGEPAYKEVFTKASRWKHFPDVMKGRRCGFQIEIPEADQKLSNRDALIERYVAAVKAIETRGGKVIIIRPPSTGKGNVAAGLVDTEKKRLPRSKFYQPLVKSCGVPAFHAEDIVGLEKLYGVDGSHLCNTDARKYTDWLARAINDLGRDSRSSAR